ncbi:helix-turn-helix domain-containing protein [Streptomyces sp. NPDC005356]|uniref:helix-turn-helix domain-containing protein n=1 Tax=Streptomyces sp. NPDC005356 TaxID=3157167 RepID=UPI0033AFFE55
MTRSDTARTARTAAGGQATRERILAAAAELFERDGFSRATVRAIAAEADADPALVVRYFGSKERLFAAVRLPHFRMPDGALNDTAALTRLLVTLADDQLSRLVDLTSLPESGTGEAVERVRDDLDAFVVRPVMNAFAIPEAGRARVEALIGAVIGTVLLRRRLTTRALSVLDQDELVNLLAPMAESLIAQSD